jgi:hypothetical protein
MRDTRFIEVHGTGHQGGGVYRLELAGEGATGGALEVGRDALALGGASCRTALRGRLVLVAVVAP